MKILIASDIHGSALYARKMIEKFHETKADRLLLLGDILYHGPRNDLPEGYAPKEVIRMLNPLKDVITCVKGNCDSEVDQMVLDFPIDKANIVFRVDGLKIFATHGHHINIGAAPDVEKGTIVLYGHTHLPLDEIRDGIRFVNPGSVSIPKENSGHRCLLLNDGIFETIFL